MPVPVRIHLLALGALAIAGLVGDAPASAAESGGLPSTAGPVAGGIQLDGATVAQEGQPFFTHDPSLLDPNAPRRPRSGDGGHGQSLRDRGDLLREGFRLLLK